MGMAAGRAAVPNTCWVKRSRSRNGSVRISMGVSSRVVRLTLQ